MIRKKNQTGMSADRGGRYYNNTNHVPCIYILYNMCVFDVENGRNTMLFVGLFYIILYIYHVSNSCLMTRAFYCTFWHWDNAENEWVRRKMATWQIALRWYVYLMCIIYIRMGQVHEMIGGWHWFCLRHIIIHDSLIFFLSRSRVSDCGVCFYGQSWQRSSARKTLSFWSTF